MRKSDPAILLLFVCIRGSCSFENLTNTNFTDDTEIPPAKWGLFAIMSVVAFVLIMLTNCSVLAVFVTKPVLWTSFNIFLMCQMSWDIIYALLKFPLGVVDSLYPYWILNWASCTVLMYATYVGSSMQMHCHVLMSVNRIWAVTFPFNYRHWYTKKTSLALCLAVVIYVHSLMLPGVILDALYYRLPLGRCVLNVAAQATWYQTINILGYPCPTVWMICSYLYVAIKRWLRIKRHTGQDGFQLHGVGEDPKVTDTTAATGLHRPAVALVKTRMLSRSFSVLTLSTMGVLLFWAPSDVYWTVSAFVDLSDHEFAHRAVVSLYFVQLVLDPVYYVIGLPDLRNEIRVMLLNRRRQDQR